MPTRVDNEGVDATIVPGTRSHLELRDNVDDLIDDFRRHERSLANWGSGSRMILRI